MKVVKNPTSAYPATTCLTDSCQWASVGLAGGRPQLSADGGSPVSVQSAYRPRARPCTRFEVLCKSARDIAAGDLLCCCCCNVTVSHLRNTLFDQ